MEFSPVHGTTGINTSQVNRHLIVNNLAKNQLFLNKDFDPISELTVFDITGRKCNLIHDYGAGESIDISQLSNGQYFLYYKENNQIKIERFVVAR